MVVTAEVECKIMFQFKYEGYFYQIEVMHLLSTGIRFFWFLLDIRFFRKIKSFKIFLVEIHVIES